MTVTMVSKETARRFLIARQRFQHDEGKKGTLEAIRRLECIQIDPVRVIHRNHHIVLHNRVCDYKPSYLDTLLNNDKHVIEYRRKEKTNIPKD